MEQGEQKDIADYRVIRRLGSGGMGTVYLVRHPTLPREEALKLLDGAISRDEGFRARFTREADLLAGLSHPNIITLHNRGETDDQRLWLTMEYVDGADAAALVRDQGPMPTEIALAVLAGAASALDYAFGRKGVTHRDVKPANIMVVLRDGRVEQVKLADFGIAKAVGEATSLTSTGLTVGTMAYISPEAITDSGTITGAADQYSLAATAYALLTGVGPFTSTGAPALMYDHLHAQVPPVSARRPDLTPAADAVLARALAKRPQDRFGSCGEFVEALRATIPAPEGRLAPHTVDTGHLVAGAAVIRRPRPTSSRRRWVLAGCAAVVVAILATVAALVIPSDGSSSTHEIPVLKTITVDKSGGIPFRVKTRAGSAFLVHGNDGAVWSLSAADYGVNQILGPECGRDGVMRTASDAEVAIRICPEDTNVTVFDPLSGAIRNRIAVGGRPIDATVSRDGKVAFVSTYNTKTLDSVSRIDLTNGAVSAMPVKMLLHRPLVSDSTGSVLYGGAGTADWSAWNVEPVADQGGAFAVPLSGSPISMVGSSDATRLYVAVARNSLQPQPTEPLRVVVVDTANPSAKQSLDVENVAGLAVSPDDSTVAAVTSNRNGESLVYLFDSRTGTVIGERSMAQKPGGWAGLAFDETGTRLIVTIAWEDDAGSHTSVNVLDARRSTGA